MALLLTMIADPALPRNIHSVRTSLASWSTSTWSTSTSAPASASSRRLGKERCLRSEAFLSLKVRLPSEKLFDNLRWCRLDVRFIAHYLQKDLPVVCSRNTVHEKEGMLIVRHTIAASTVTGRASRRRRRTRSRRRRRTRSRRRRRTHSRSKVKCYDLLFNARNIGTNTAEVFHPRVKKGSSDIEDVQLNLRPVRIR